MLLRPRKFLHKSFFKKRKIKTQIIKSPFYLDIYNSFNLKLKYGQTGLLNKNHAFIFYNKHLFKLKLFLKKAVRRSNVTNRILWLKIFPHIPITKKVIGSRMGKGKGKPSNWGAKIPYNSIFIELKNVRYGRSKYFLRQIKYKLPGLFLIIFKYKSCSSNNLQVKTSNFSTQYVFFT